MSHALYPPAPAQVAPEITQLDGAYRLRVVAMIGGLFAFLLLYLLFVAAAGFVAYWLLTLPIPDVKGRGLGLFLILKYGGAVAALLLWLFLFKGLFKCNRVQRAAHLALAEKDFPELFAFVRRVHEDAGAPRPRRIYVSPEVNAALIYDTSLLNLFIPPGKDLLMGLGLVNVVTLAEFKAVLAHEFGHFAQRSIGLGSYLHVANRVMHDVIYSRDALDRFVDGWANQDMRVSFPAWGLKGVLWIVRKILAGSYQGLNLLHLSLSRQMEFNADNVAVSMTGSDALIHGLARLEFAASCLNDAAQSLDAAADHGLFSDDLFHHQGCAAVRIRRLSQNAQAGLPPDLPADPAQRVQVFQPVDDGIPERYRSHPTDHMREQNAKRIYIRSALDDRSAWLLFGDATALKREVTGLFYRQMLGRREEYAPRPAAEVQQFIDAELAESTYDPRYQGLYDDRFINPGEIPDRLSEPWPRDKALVWLAGWPPADLVHRVQTLRERQSEYQLLRGLANGELTLKGKTFPFRDQQCSMRDVDRLLKTVDKELDSTIEAFHGLDREVFLAHGSLAHHLDDDENAHSGRQSELLERYRFHMQAQGLLQSMLAMQGRLHAVLGLLSHNSQLSEGDFAEVRGVLEEIRMGLAQTLRTAETTHTPALSNVPAGSTLGTLIVDRGDNKVPPLSGNSISGEWLGHLSAHLEGVLNRLKRVHFKSLGSLLVCQQKLAEQAKKSWDAPETDSR